MSDRWEDDTDGVDQGNARHSMSHRWEDDTGRLARHMETAANESKCEVVHIGKRIT